MRRRCGCTPASPTRCCTSAAPSAATVRVADTRPAAAPTTRAARTTRCPTLTAAPAATPLARPRAPARPSRPAAWATLARRRISLSAHTPREILAPLATPLLFALVIAPALAKIIQATGGGGVDYSTFVIVGTVGLLIPLTCTFAGIGVIVDRATGARRELLTAPIPRALIVLGNMAVAIGVRLLQAAALMAPG